MSYRADVKGRVLAWAVAAACSGSAIASDVVVCRVGSGVATLTTAAASVFLERHASDGMLVQTFALPTTVSGSNRRLTLGGTKKGECGLVVSSDGNYLTLAGYDAAPGTASVSASASSMVNRIVARVDAAGNVDTTTRLNGAFDTASVTGAASVDGSAFWVSGNGASGLGGIWYLAHGATGGLQILANPNDVRTLNIASGQLFGTTNTATFTSIFSVGTGLPKTVGQSTSPLYGLPMAQVYGFAFFDRSRSNGGLDRLYIANDNSIAAGGGIQKWSFDGSIWYLVTTFTDGLGTAGVRGLAAEAQGANIVLYATTAESTGNKLVRVVDDDSASPTATVIATAPDNTAYRGVALAWVAPVADVIFKDAFE
jgi:hypothetical protein